MKLHIAVKTVKQAIVKATLMGAVLGLGALLGGAAWKAATTASRVCEAVQAWEDKGLHATNVWWARELLARQGWLGPLRPSPPLDPLEACGLVPGEASACWWRLLLQPRRAGRLLACLEERVVEAEHDHEAFGARLCWGVILALVVPLGLVAARRLARRWVKGVNGHQESPGDDCFVDAPEADAGEALVEDWATPAADVDVTEETWTTATAVVEEIDEEECWATPAEYVEELMVQEEESKAADDDSVGAESTPTDLSPAADDCVEEQDPQEMNVLATAENVECVEEQDPEEMNVLPTAENVECVEEQDPEEMNVLATAENVECEEVKEEGGGEENTEQERTDSDADNKAADKAEEAADEPPVPGEFVQDKVVSEDPEGLAGEEPQRSTLWAEEAPMKKKRKRKRKNLGPADVLKASGDAHVQDEHKTDAKTDVKKKAAQKAETKGKAVPRAEVKGKAVPKAETKGKAAPKGETKGKAVPRAEVKGKAVPKAETKGKAAPKAETKGKAVPRAEVKGKAVPKAETKGKAAPKGETKGKAVPRAEVKGKAVPKAETKGKATPKGETKGKAVPRAEVKGKAVPKAETKGKAMTPADEKKTTEVKKNVTVKQVTRTKKKPAPAQPKAAPPSPPLHSVRQSWQEDVVTVRLPVPPARRRHVIGPRGDTVRQLRRDYPGVHVAVPLPKDADAHVTFRGPKSQAAAASQEVAARLQTIEAQIREAARIRQQAVATAVLDVAPNRRRLVVGPGGEELLKLQQQHPGVRVSVPPAIDTESRSVTITGPPAEVRAVQAKIKNRLAAIERQRQLLRARRRRRHQGAASASGASPAKGC
ncbi:ribosome-binding protein 1-like isoform X3 [Eriocheir sinensis]|uniref:ribosome-binding protein 1-like isoform X3 n=1 Tax=Eriocheir sinensis TaxID=95602 RepID=UPI0021CA2055|nr:ribosome-binding protein 1-like isoform X3 [Eriocheir sinensis]